MSLKSFFLSAPIDGLNLRSSPYTISATEAQQLDNYVIYDWGIRETGSYNALSHPASGAIGQLISFKDSTGTPKQLICVNNQIWESTTVTWGGSSNLTGALTVTSNAWRYTFWRKRIFMVNATNPGLIYDIAAGTLTADTFTGLTTDNVSQQFIYKSRIYNIEKDSTSVWYGDVAAVAGALTELDVSEFMEDYGTLLFGCSWSVNQGDQNEQLLVLVSTSGEILLYSGDNPGADNWTIITRVSIPEPIGNQAFIRLGQDVLIVTSRGVISLAAVVAGRQDEETYYNRSIKLGDVFGSVNVKPIKDTKRPFLYFASSSANYIYILNYERGAWSRLDTTIASGTITALSFFDNDNYAGNYLNISFSSGTSSYMDESQGNSQGHVWRTGFLPIEPDKFKQIQKVRAIGRNILGTTQFVNTLASRFDVSSGNTATDTKSQSTTAGTYTFQDLQPAGVGKRPSLVFSKASSGEQNEIVGCDIFYSETGGQE